MYQPPLFKEERLDVLHGLIRAHPFGLIVSVDAEGEPVANAIPLLLDAATGEKGTLRGHLAKANPQWKMLAAGGRALRRSTLFFRSVQSILGPRGSRPLMKSSMFV